MNRVLLSVDECVELLLEVVGDARDRLQSATISTVVEDFGVKVRVRADAVVAGCCTVAGTYFHGPPRIAVADSPTPRRIAFTALHEFAHHLIRRDYRFTSLARSPEREERVCDRFAAEILVPSTLVDDLVSPDRPRAKEIVDLYRLSHGSGAVCARSVSERFNAAGYVVVAVDNVITYAFSVDMLVDLESQVIQPSDSLFAEAATSGMANGVTQLLCRPGHWTGPLAGDVALGDDNLMFGVFIDDAMDSQWGAQDHLESSEGRQGG